MVRSSHEGGEQLATPHFRSKCNTLVNYSELEKTYDESVEKIKQSFLEYQREGSGFRLEEVSCCFTINGLCDSQLCIKNVFLCQVIHLQLGYVTYTPLKGASYLPLPNRIKNKRSVLNIQNHGDQKCFLWVILAKLYHVDSRNNPYRVTHYISHESEVNMSGIQYPVKTQQISRFERQNPAISVNVIGFENGEFFPVYVTKEKKGIHADLLLYSQGAQNHYCLIRNLSGLLNNRTSYEHRMFYCAYCLHGFVRQDLVDDHEPHCSRHGPQKIKLPDEDHATLSFKEVQKQLKVPFIIHADFDILGADRVRDHDHMTGLYRTTGPAHNECNINYKFTGKIPVVFHNYKFTGKIPVVFHI